MTSGVDGSISIHPCCCDIPDPKRAERRTSTLPPDVGRGLLRRSYSPILGAAPLTTLWAQLGGPSPNDGRSPESKPEPTGAASRATHPAAEPSRLSIKLPSIFCGQAALVLGVFLPIVILPKQSRRTIGNDAAARSAPARLTALDGVRLSTYSHPRVRRQTSARLDPLLPAPTLDLVSESMIRENITSVKKSALW